MSDVANNQVAQNLTLRFDDEARGPLSPNNEAPVSGTYRPSNATFDDRFPAPAPTGPYTTTLSPFDNQVANGTWRLFVVDDAGLDLGEIAGGWSLSITTKKAKK
ncbi:MAG: hypothetical protein ACT4OS_01665 [Acidimicrobiales bacterium]